MKRLVIVGNGEPPSKDLLTTYLTEETFVIAADGGANILHEHGFTPDLYLGDFDSIKEEPGGRSLAYPAEKDMTDSELALLKAISYGPEEIILLGHTGRRSDHYGSNLLLLFHPAAKNISLMMVDAYSKIFPIDKKGTYQEPAGTFFSLVCFSEVLGLTIEGAKYPLDRVHVPFPSSWTISNEFVGGPIEVSFDKGYVLGVIAREE